VETTPIMPHELWDEICWEEVAQRLQTAPSSLLREVATKVALAAADTLPESGRARLAVALTALTQSLFDEDEIANVLELADEYSDGDAFEHACACRALAGALEADPRVAARRALNEGRYAFDNERHLLDLLVLTLA